MCVYVLRSGRFPNVFNLATRADITANATCGQIPGGEGGGGGEQFCKLVEHVRRNQGTQIQCGTCAPDSEQGGEEVHSIRFAIDGTNRWWQSPTIANGWRYNWVTVTLDLKQASNEAVIGWTRLK